MRFRMIHRFEPKGVAKAALSSVIPLYREEIPRQLYLPKPAAATLFDEKTTRLTKAQHPVYFYKPAAQAADSITALRNGFQPLGIDIADAILLGHYGCGFYGGAGFPDGEPRIGFFLKARISGSELPMLVGIDNVNVKSTGMFSMLLPFGSEAEQKLSKYACEQLIDAQYVSTIFEVNAEADKLAYVRSPFGHLRPSSAEELNLDAVVRLYSEAFLILLQRRWV